MPFLITALLAFAACFVLTKAWLFFSPKLSAFQAIREEGPAAHKTAKQNTPTLGGVAILGSVFLAVSAVWNVRVWTALSVFLLCGFLGLADDRLKIAKGKNLGLKARHKLAGQLLIGLFLGWIFQKTGVSSQIFIPGIGVWNSGVYFLPVVAFVVIASSNAVNLTDGLDGLAAGTAAAVAAFFFIFSVASQDDPGPAFFSAALLGALLAFLWFNAHPARVFMGDVGSLALGGALAALAFQTGTVFWFAVASGVFVAETLSVILQVAFFKLTGGRRIFKMSPLHHHWELSGVPETQVVLRFWIVSGFLCWAALLGALHGS